MTTTTTAQTAPGLITRKAAGADYELVGSLPSVHPATVHEPYLAYLADPTTAILIITVTEAGYLRDGQGRLDVDHLSDEVTACRAALVERLSKSRAAPTGPDHRRRLDQAGDPHRADHPG